MSADEPVLATDPAPAPGWYPTAYGWQCWDGRQWYPPAAPAAGTDEKTLAVLSHLGAFLGGFVLPLVFFLISKDKPYARHHAAEALNFQIAYMLAVFAGVALMMLAMGVTGGFSDDDPGAGFFMAFSVTFGLIMLVALGHIVLSIVGAVKASRMEWWRYPVNIRLVKP